MNAMLLFTLAGVIVAAFAFAWAFSNPENSGGSRKGNDLTFEQQAGRRHATYLPVICQAMSPADFRFLAARVPVKLVRKAHKERQRIAMLYLTELRREFRGLQRLARAIAALSPEVRAAQEFERFRLTAQFSWRYQIVLLALYSGLLLLPQLCGLSVIVSELAVRLEAATQELGERAALAAELASSLDRRGLDLA